MTDEYIDCPAPVRRGVLLSHPCIGGIEFFCTVEIDSEVLRQDLRLTVDRFALAGFGAVAGALVKTSGVSSVLVRSTMYQPSS